MLTLTLSTEKAQLLTDLIDRAIDELRNEIHHTDSQVYKEDLKQQLESLKAIRVQLEANQPQRIP